MWQIIELRRNHPILQIMTAVLGHRRRSYRIFCPDCHLIKYFDVPACVTSGGVAAFHQPKSKSSSRERLRAGGDSGVPSEDDDDDDDPCISRSSPECHGTECDHGAEGGHDHFHLRVGSSSSGDFRSKSSLRNDRYKCFGLLESNILNSFQLQNFRRKNGSEYDSANSSGVFGSSKKFNSMVIPHFSPWRPPRSG
ncbi:hypothetical protein pipiens_012652 [Culex pipiens pipiens]|uniref:Uncharacterized protein n=1 Tax=Culex pipiens pipiens TaxID=38569 RepID=A0ABD1D1F6_CULPP